MSFVSCIYQHLCSVIWKRFLEMLRFTGKKTSTLKFRAGIIQKQITVCHLD